MQARKIFISYTQTDRQWAEWIAWQLEAAGHAVRLQAWDFPAGSNFIHEMNKATTWADVTVMVLSGDYLASKFCSVEWYAALVDDPMGDGRALLPFRVRPCRPTGLLKPLVYVDLVNVGPDEARQRMWAALEKGRRKPDTEPVFPGGAAFKEAPNSEPTFSPLAIVHQDPRIQQLAEQLEASYTTLHEQESEERDTTAIRTQILDLRRKMREGGLKKGDFLADGRYKLLRSIGKGGFAQVWKAYDKQTRRQVAIKVLHLQYAEDKTRRERFERGAEQMVKFQHQGVVQVFDEVREDGGYYFFVMEYLPGGDFQQAVQAGRLSQTERLDIVLRVGEALLWRMQLEQGSREPSRQLRLVGRRSKVHDLDRCATAERGRVGVRGPRWSRARRLPVGERASGLHPGGDRGVRLGDTAGLLEVG